MALLLAAIGIYGVISYSVEQRSQETGIRMSLGAKPRTIVFPVARQTLLLTLIGLSLGIGLSFGFVRLIGSQLQGLAVSNAGGPMTFVTVSLVLMVVAELASFLPARRAVRVEPLIALRYQ